MKLTQNWVGYLDRSYEQVKKSVIKRLVINNPEVTDHSESNILIVVISVFSGIAEMLNYYIDTIAREAYLGTAKKYTSVVKLTKLIDYRIKARSYPTVDLLFTLTDNVGQLTPSVNPVFIPQGTLVRNPTGITFIVLREVSIPPGQTGVYATAAQYEDIMDEVLGVSDGSANQKFILPLDYVHNSLKVVINSEQWNLYSSLGQMKSTTKGYVVDIEEDGNAYLKFGDGVNGVIPIVGNTIYGTYRVTNGATGNLPPNTIETIVSSISVEAGITLTVTNPDYASGGSDFEGIEDIRNRAPRYIRSIDRAVTYQDYIDVALQVPGVGAAEVSYCCGKYVDVYIVPQTKGTSTLGLIDQVQSYMDFRKMITTKVKVRASGISKIWLKVKIYGKPLYDTNDILIPVINSLDENFGFGTISINTKIAVSDIIFVLEGVLQVDRVEVEQVRIVPFARPIENTTTNLNIIFVTYPASNIPINYEVVYKAISDSFQVFREGVFMADIAPSGVYNDGVAHFQLLSGSYSNNNRWQFTITKSYPEIFPMGTLEVKDFTAAIVDVGPLIDEDTPRTIFSDIQIITQNVTAAGLPPCA